MQKELLFHLFSFLDFIYLFLERREGEREGEKHQCVVTSWALPTGGPGQKPRHVPWLGTEPATLWFVGPCSIHWAIPARASFLFLEVSLPVFRKAVDFCEFILYPQLYLFIVSNSFLVESLGISIYRIMSHEKNLYFFLPNLDAFYSFLLPDCSARTSRIMLGKNSESSILVLFLILEE